MSTPIKKRPLDDLSDEQFKALADAATATGRYTFALHAVNLISLIAVIAIGFHLATYIRAHSPPLEHRVFLGVSMLVLLPLALIKARELAHGWLFERALLRQLAAGPTGESGGR